MTESSTWVEMVAIMYAFLNLFRCAVFKAGLHTNSNYSAMVQRSWDVFEQKFIKLDHIIPFELCHLSYIASTLSYLTAS